MKTLAAMPRSVQRPTKSTSSGCNSGSPKLCRYAIRCPQRSSSSNDFSNVPWLINPGAAAVSGADSTSRSGCTRSRSRSGRSSHRPPTSVLPRSTSPHRPHSIGPVARQSDNSSGWAAYPELPSHRLDVLMNHLSIPPRPDRHRARPDAEITAALFRRIIADGVPTGRRWCTLRQLREIGGYPAKATRPHQNPLFE